MDEKKEKNEEQNSNQKEKKLKYRRILLKLSGEIFGGEKKFGLEPSVFYEIADEIIEAYNLGAEISIVVGGGNIIRGITAEKTGIDRTTADYMGMLATIINALFLQEILEKKGYQCRVMSAVHTPALCEPYIRRRAIRHLEKGRIVIFAGGTGNPYFSTDTAASLRASEIKADVILKATKVDGVYDSDPLTNKEAVKFDEISYAEFLRLNLKIMDATSVTLCMERKIPIIVFNIYQKGNIKRILLGEKVGTLVHA
ncbi:Uridylate kinase [bacterium HR19]|nr:Uridylate kinase [bacterium HR19]